ncbi:MAG: lamin tail domain-containing protein [Nocardioidaceae bacterium]
MLFRIAATAASSALILTSAAGAAHAAPSPVRFSAAQYNSPGPDNGSNKSLNAEWVAVHNYGGKARTLTGWTVRDRSRHVFHFPTFTLPPGATVRIHTGRGPDGARNLYWGSRAYIWNNTGDKATLKNAGAVTVDSCQWGNGPGFTRC